jgi:chromosomal replication initiator protein
MAKTENNPMNEIQKIKRAIARAYHVTPYLLEGPLRLAQLVEPRHVAMWFCRALTKESLAEIGRQFGGRHQKTVAWAVRSVANRCQTEMKFRVKIGRLSTEVEKALHPELSCRKKKDSPC